MTREGINADNLSVLHEPTPPAEIRQRQGPRKHEGACPKFGPCSQLHLMLDYIDARYVMDRLDHLGPGNWQDRYMDRTGGSVRCGIGLLIDGEWVWKWDVGTQSDIEPEKGSYSEAFKRAAVKWGIGRDLYGHKAPAAPARPAPARLPARTAPAAPQRPETPVAAPARTSAPPAEPEDMFAADDGLVQAAMALAEEQHVWREGDKHDPTHKPLLRNARGLFCGTKLPDGTWCQWTERGAKP
jgi:hypothetical protein